jgi:hypothetical protein
MRRSGRYAILAGACACAAIGAIVWPRPAEAVCSVLSRHPCTPTVCSVFRGRPCRPQYPFPLGENLQLTVDSAQSQSQSQPADAGSHDQGGNQDQDRDHQIDTIHDMFAALRACWQPPATEQEHQGMQMSVRFAFNRSGAIIGEPRVTFTTPGVDDKTRAVYHDAIMASLARCTPLHFTDGMAGAIAGRPLAVRFIDNRNQQGQQHQP